VDHRHCRVELADSALFARQAGFEDTDFFPDLDAKAVVLACRIAWNHPLPAATSEPLGVVALSLGGRGGAERQIWRSRIDTLMSATPAARRAFSSTLLP